MARTTRPLALLVCALAALPAQAEPAKQDAAVQQALRKAQGALRQLAEDKARLEEENAALQKDKAALQEQAAKLEAALKPLEALPAELEKQKAAAAALQAANAGLQGQLDSGRQREEGLHGKLKNTVGQARKIQADNRLLVEAVKEREEWISQCRQKNAALLAAEQEVLRHYQEESVWDKLGEAEPFTGIAKVKAENAAQDYRFKLQDLQITPFQSQNPELKPEPAKAAVEEDEEEDAPPAAPGPQ